MPDVYETGLEDENLFLVYKAYKEIFMAVSVKFKKTKTLSFIWVFIQLARNVYSQNIDIIGITRVGHKAQMMNAFMNIKTAEKNLQFGANKYKSILIGKDLKTVLNSNLSLDMLNVKHKEDLVTGEEELKVTES